MRPSAVRNRFFERAMPRSNKKPSRREIQKWVTEIGPGDGSDPRFDSRGRSGPVRNRKTLQLCAQVERTLASVLAESTDEWLRDLWVVAVEPAPNETRLLVTLQRAPSGTDRDPAELFTHVLHAAAKLRAEVASAIHRRKTPELAYRLAT
jgi:ribosome-binding factor A